MSMSSWAVSVWDSADLRFRIVFDGVWTGYLPLNCTYQFVAPLGESQYLFDAGIQCQLPGGEISVRPNVTHEVVYQKIPDRGYTG